MSHIFKKFIDNKKDYQIQKNVQEDLSPPKLVLMRLIF